MNAGLFFGRGFYTNIITPEISDKNIDRYRFHLKWFLDEYSEILVFDKPDKNWYKYIYENYIGRKSIETINYDLVIGPRPTANIMNELLFTKLINYKLIPDDLEQFSSNVTSVVIKSEVAAEYLEHLGEK